MLYKVTPMMAPPTVETKKTREPGAPRKRRKTAIYDADGAEVLITLMCLKCKSMKPLALFGLRKMADGAIRNQPWCRTCRSGASSKKNKLEQLDAQESESQSVSAPPHTAEVVESPSTAPAPLALALSAEPASESA